MILMFVVDATEDVLGVTRLHHVALTGFFWLWMLQKMFLVSRVCIMWH